jgi:hypothetical protein
MVRSKMNAPYPEYWTFAPPPLIARAEGIGRVPMQRFLGVYGVGVKGFDVCALLDNGARAAAPRIRGVRGEGIVRRALGLMRGKLAQPWTARRLAHARCNVGR